jgi:hypothetical protein
MRLELALALGWTLADVDALDDAELSTVLELLETRHGR